VLSDLRGRIDLILDGGPTSVGIESTIVACLDRPMLLRPGGLPRDTIERLLGAPVADAPPGEADAPLAPGMLASHYAPHARLRLNARDIRDGEALLAFGPDRPAGAATRRTLNLSASGDLVEAAANLFSHLRALDFLNATTIAVMPIPGEGLGEAINDRLGRAAAPKET
jgi:L-threonylcarbamoyladenylate synthase